MLPPEIGVPALALLHVLVLAGVGVGPALLLLPQRAETAIAVAPAAGLGLASAVLTTVALLVPLQVAGPVVLGLLLVLSGVLTWRVRGAGGAARIWPGLVIAGGALLAACAPMLLGANTYGPVNLYFADSWFYIPVDQFLSGHALSDTPASPARWPWLAFPLQVHEDDTRVGIDTLQAALFGLTGTSPARGAMAAQAAIAAIVPLTTYGAARAIYGDVQRRWACVAAVASVTPVTVQLFVDPRPANLAAVSLAVLFVLAAGVALTSGDARRPAVLAGFAASGLLVCYTEHTPTIVVGTAVGLLATIAIARDRRDAIRRALTVAGVAALAAVLVSPLGFARAVEYAIRLGDGAIVGGPAIAGLQLRSLAPLFGGTVHQYQLDVVASWTATRELLTYGLGLAALGIATFGVARVRRAELPAALVLCGAVVSTSIALYAWFQLRGECSYCVAKTATLSPPLIALAGTFGLLMLSRELREPGERGVLAVGAAVWLGFVLVADLMLIAATERTPMRLDERDHEITAAVAELPRGPLLVEGSESGPDVAPFFDVPAALYLTSVTGRTVRYPELGLAYIFGSGLPKVSYAPDYRYVLSRYPGMQTGRRPVRTFGQYGLYERADVDVAIVGQQLRDVRDQTADAIPWLRNVMTLRVAGAARGAVIRMALRGTDAPAAAFSVSTGTIAAPPAARGPRRVCLWIPPGDVAREVTFVVNGMNLAATPRRVVDLPPRSPRAVGVARIVAQPAARNPCDPGRTASAQPSPSTSR